jgi:L-iditol 2-dehydrogenase
MKALVLEQYKQFIYKEVADPKPGNGEVRIRVKACGICGSDIHGMDGSTGRRRPPLIMGHEAAGVVDQTGPGVEGWEVGERVTFDSTLYKLDDWYTLRGMYNLSDGRTVLGVAPDEYRQHGAFAEYVIVPQHVLYKLPDNVSFEHAAMVEPFAVAAHAINLAAMEYGSAVLVLGTGLVGLCLVQLLRRSNASVIVAVDLDADRLALAAQFGADITIDGNAQDIADTVMKATGGRGVDCAFEVVGIGKTVQSAIEHTRRGGTVTLVGNLSPHIEFPLQTVVTRQLRIQGSCSIRGEYPTILSLMSKGAIDPAPLISAIAPLEEGAQWFGRLYGGEKGLNKVILTP